MKLIEKAITEFRNCPDGQAHIYARKLVYEIFRAMDAGAPFIIPVILPDFITEKFGKNNLSPDELRTVTEDFDLAVPTMRVGDDMRVYCCFTSYEEAAKNSSVATLTTEIDDYLEMILMNDRVDGIYFNPFGNLCFLPKDLIREVFEFDYLNSKENETARTVEVVLNDNSAVEEAIAFATECHKGAVRKGTDIPYITHPMEVMQILNSVNADNNLLIAGLLHDVVEDAGVSIETIKEKYGEDVAHLVAGHSEDKSKTWYARKLKTIRDLPDEDIRSKLLTLGDKLSNIRSMYRDYKQIGDELWQRFNAPKHLQAWYYSGIVDGLAELQNIPQTADAYWELSGIYKDLFVKYYIDEQNGVLYQISASGEGYYLEKGIPQWKPLKQPMPDNITEIDRRTAERTEDNWNEVFRQIHSQDMQDGEYVLCSVDNTDYIITIKDNNLAYCTEKENSRNCLCQLDEENTHRFLVQFRLFAGAENSIGTLLTKYFGTENGPDVFAKFCEMVGVISADV